MPKCHCDNGKKTISVTSISAEGRKESSCVIDCIDCKGTGEISKERLEFIEYMKTLWCECDPHPNTNVTYHPHGNEVCAKHCYTCNHCGKIVQIG
jgi:hypothetical protein